MHTTLTLKPGLPPALRFTNFQTTTVILPDNVTLDAFTKAGNLIGWGFDGVEYTIEDTVGVQGTGSLRHGLLTYVDDSGSLGITSSVRLTINTLVYHSSGQKDLAQRFEWTFPTPVELKKFINIPYRDCSMLSTKDDSKCWRAYDATKDVYNGDIHSVLSAFGARPTISLYVKNPTKQDTEYQPYPCMIDANTFWLIYRMTKSTLDCFEANKLEFDGVHWSRKVHGGGRAQIASFDMNGVEHNAPEASQTL